MFLATYSLRRVLTTFFVMKTGAEKTRDAVTQILDNLPDAVLMFEAGELSYCNQQTDRCFSVELSRLNSIEDNTDLFRSSQYLILNNRCLYELK
jgi:hypothetical protein